AKISELLNSAVSQTRNLSRGLDPVVAEPNGLMSALEALAGLVTDVFRVPCEFGCPRPVLLEDNVLATHVYRIAQEAAPTRIKHGRPQRIEIVLSSQAGETMLRVSDDGIGLKAQRGGSTGMGLRIMRYRASVVNGRLTVENRAGGGTEVVCTIHKPAI